jgi:transcriptional regulator with XRE-family HTH domain
LAAKVGLTGRAISHYEFGLREPSPEILARLDGVLRAELLDNAGGSRTKEG